MLDFNAGNRKVWLRALQFVGTACFWMIAATSANACDRYADYIMDARTGEVLHQDAADTPRFPACLTQLMTLYLVFEALQRGNVSL